MKLRRTTNTPVATPPQPPPAVKPGGKGRPTPKRNEAQKRRAVTAAPTDRKAAARRMREEAKVRRAEQALALETGDERNYGPMHAGRERALVRDIVDSRRSFGWLGMPGFLLLLPILFLSTASTVLAGIANALVFGLVAVVGWDYFAVRRRIKKVLAEKYPTGTKESTRVLTLYGIQRNNTWPKRRKPKARVGVGEPI